MVDLGIDLTPNPPKKPSFKKPVPMVDSPREFPEPLQRPGAIMWLYISSGLMWFAPAVTFFVVSDRADGGAGVCAAIGSAIVVSIPYTAFAMSMAYILDWLHERRDRD